MSDGLYLFWAFDIATGMCCTDSFSNTSMYLDSQVTTGSLHFKWKLIATEPRGPATTILPEGQGATKQNHSVITLATDADPDPALASTKHVLVPAAEQKPRCSWCSAGELVLMQGRSREHQQPSN